MTDEQVLLKAKALKELADIEASAGDTETDHLQADAVLTELLTALGFEDVVEAWDNLKKWYA